MKPLWWINRVVADVRISLDARALLIFFGTRPAGWRYSVDEARAVSGFGKQKYFHVLADLKRLGYIVTDHKRNRRGRIIHARLIVRDSASPESRKSGLRAERHHNPDFKECGPESRKSVQTSLTDSAACGANVSPFPSQGLKRVGGGHNV